VQYNPIPFEKRKKTCCSIQTDDLGFASTSVHKVMFYD